VDFFMGHEGSITTADNVFLLLKRSILNMNATDLDESMHWSNTFERHEIS